MAKLRVKLKEMTDAAVSYISLVDRAASRMPIRIMKSYTQESQMLDLSNPRSLLSRALKGEAKPAVQVSAVVTMDHGDDLMPQVTEALKAHGFAVDKVTKQEDGTMMFAQSEDPLVGGQVVRLSNDLLLVVKGLDATVDEELGFVPGVGTAIGELQSGVLATLGTEGTADELATHVSSLVQKFEASVLSLVKKIPQAAFKADFSVSEVLKMDKKKKMTAAEKAAEEAAETAAEEAMEAAAVEAKKAEGVKPVVEVITAKEPSDMDKLVSSLAQISSAVAEVVSKVEALNTEIKAVKTSQAASEQRLDEVAKKADTSAHALNTTVLAAPAAPDAASGKVVAVKADTDPRTGCFDTANLPRRR